MVQAREAVLLLRRLSCLRLPLSRYVLRRRDVHQQQGAEKSFPGAAVHRGAFCRRERRDAALCSVHGGCVRMCKRRPGSQVNVRRCAAARVRSAR